jgi:hypothetical protein
VAAVRHGLLTLRIIRADSLRSHVVRAERRALLLLAAAAVVLAVLHHVTGAGEFVLYGGPALLIAGLLLSGRYVGEERILARRAAAAPLPRPERRTWVRTRERALASLLDRSPRLLRGPPAPAAA